MPFSHIAEVIEPSRHPEIAQQIASLVFDETYELEHTPQILIDNFARSLGRRITVAAFDDQGQVIATGAVAQSDPPYENMLVGVATRPEHRNAGIGTKVVLELHRLTSEVSIAKLHVHPLPGAVKFYSEKLGYEPVADGKWVKSLSRLDI